jgi:xylulokinase
MFLSRVFRQTFANVSGAMIELYNTSGAEGAARGAGIGIGFYKDAKEAFSGLIKLETIEPRHDPLVEEAYTRWKRKLGNELI